MNIAHAMRCSHCGRELVGVAVLFPGKPAVCGRADCLGWALALTRPSASSDPGDGTEVAAAA